MYVRRYRASICALGLGKDGSQWEMLKVEPILSIFSLLNAVNTQMPSADEKVSG